jgi:hypothetical protein
MSYPVASTCPKCGSREFREVVAPVAPESLVAGVAYDRECTACDTTYTPPTPLWENVVFIVLGIPILLAFFYIGWLIYTAVTLFRKGLRFIRRQDKPITSDTTITSLPRLPVRYHHLRYFDH